jgi:hypothetical protein
MITIKKFLQKERFLQRNQSKIIMNNQNIKEEIETLIEIAKIRLQNGKRKNAENILKSIIFRKDEKNEKAYYLYWEIKEMKKLPYDQKHSFFKCYKRNFEKKFDENKINLSMESIKEINEFKDLIKKDKEKLVLEKYEKDIDEFEKNEGK